MNLAATVWFLPRTKPELRGTRGRNASERNKGRAARTPHHRRAVAREVTGRKEDEEKAGDKSTQGLPNRLVSGNRRAPVPIYRTGYR